jgi:hypothetical protein
LSRLLLLTACFAGGLLLAASFERGSGPWLLLAVLGAALALRRRRWAAVTPLLSLAAGGLAIALRLAAAQDHDVHGELRGILEGTVEATVRTPRGARIVLADVQNADPAGAVLPSRVELMAVRGAARGLEHARPGERALRELARTPAVLRGRSGCVGGGSEPWGCRSSRRSP